MKLTVAGFGILTTILIFVVYNNDVHAQVTPDNTLNTSVTSTSGNNIYTITNGDRVGNNLFHSFSQFSIPTGASASFVNDITVKNIFSRVTGGNISNIDGAISANGSANLFLLNPVGIIFGQNASLNIGGSFVATTANSIKFADGTEFRTNNLDTSPLLTMSVPIGLQMGQNLGTITIKNTGHRLIEGNNVPLEIGNTPNGLQVTVGKTLALFGGEIILDGGILNASAGHIELGSAVDGTINLSTASPEWNFDYGNIQKYGDMRFSSQALVNTSGLPGGSIHLQGQNISINQGSAILSINQGNQLAGKIQVDATDSLTMQAVGNYGFAQSLVATNAIAGTGGNVIITAPQLLLEDGAKINAHTFAEGIAGNIFVQADTIQLIGFSPLKPSTTRSGIMSETYGRGRAGDIQVTTRQLKMQDGGSITGASFGTGSTGNVSVNAADFIELQGETPISFSASLIGTVSFNRGNGGEVTVNTSQLSIRKGAGVSASTLGQGNAGTLRVNVSQKISVSGVSEASGKVAGVSASATVLPLSFQKAFRLSALPTGNSGDLIINTPHLEITDGGEVRVNHQGVGNAGSLYINAKTVNLNRSGKILANTNSGQGGGINLQADTLILRQGSNITATAGNTGNGGNISINSPIILGLEDSDIVANAFQGQGGNIQINTQSIFGLKYRDRLTPENDITASSQFGLSGTVQVNTVGVDPNAGLVELPANVTDSSQQIASGCSANEGSSFVATGRGGIPQNPNQDVTSDHTWSDIRDISAYRKTQPVQAQIPPSSEVLVQATSWHRNADGKIELITDKSLVQVQQALNCAAVPKSSDGNRQKLD
ncbi:MAG: filamentous hemagglutinin N-terminal domain-containing protein [Nostoc sp.]|uniref:two-partner secretion domain-containing protein n=1 Tax=Nostoc sp. TaxID=1180 RepID=UPI002FF9824A